MDKATQLSDPSARQPFVSVIVVNYNGGRRLQECLRTLLADSYTAREIIVVDNASTDDSAYILNQVRDRHPEITVLHSPSNLGYAGAVNLALSSARGEYVAVMNMDITVERGWLESLIAFLEDHPDAGAVNPLISLADGKRINAAGLDVHITGLGFTRSLGRSVENIRRSPVRVSGISGAAFVIRRVLLDRIGGMDASGFLYHEDVNLSWLLQLMGSQLYCLPESVVRHDYVLTMYPKKLYLLERNRWSMLLAYVRRTTLAILIPVLALTEVAMWCYCIRRGRAFIRAKWESYLWVKRQWPQIQARRRVIHSVRVRSDWAVIKKLRWAYAWNQLLALGKERGASQRQNIDRLSEERTRMIPSSSSEFHRRNKTPKVSLIVVNYNGRHFLSELFQSLARQTRPADEVIMVDNASEDGSVDYIRERFPWVKVIASPANVGFAEGNNIGLENSTGEYVALLNNDTVVDERWLEELVTALDKDEMLGAAVSKIYLATGKTTIDCAGAEFNNLGFSWGRGSNQLDQGQFDLACESPALTACAVLLRRSALGGTPIFDPGMFMYYEEFDLALRLRGHGYKILYVPTSVVHHKRSQAVKGLKTDAFLFQQFYGNRNRIKIVMKYYPLTLLLRNLPLILLSLGYWDWRFLREGGPKFFLGSVFAQAQFAAQGLVERLRGNTVNPGNWVPWMKRQTLREVLALKSTLGGYVEYPSTK